MANNGGNNTNVTRRPTEKIEDNVEMMKAVFNYFQPLLIWNESLQQMDEIRVQDDTPEEELTPEDKLYLIMRTTADYLSHLCVLIDTEYVRQMHSNIHNLYNIFGVDFEKKPRQDNANVDENFYYYFKGNVNYTKITKDISSVPCLDINKKIEELIERAHSEESQNTPVEITDVHSKSIILFGHLLHHLVGTMDTNWVGKTKYFDNYKIVDSDDPRNQSGIKIKIQRKKKADQLESDSKNLEENPNNLNNRSEEDLGELNKSMANIGGNNANVTRRPTEKIEDNVELMKAVFNYFQPLLIWNESVKQMKEIKVQPNTPKSDLSPEDKLYLIMRTTADYLSHLCCIIDTKYIYYMYTNMYNLYNICEVDLKEKKNQSPLLETNPIDNNYYYYLSGNVNSTKVPENILPVKRNIINNEIKRLIKRAHSKESQNPLVEITDRHSKSIILFCHLLHHLVGTMDPNNWVGKTKYFANYKIVVSDDPRTQQDIKIKIQREKTGQFESDAKNLVKQWNNMNNLEEHPNKMNNPKEENLGGTIMIIGSIIGVFVAAGLVMLKKFIYGK